MKKVYILLVAIATVVTSCNSNKVPKDAKRVDPIVKKEAAKANFELSNFTLNLPESWIQEEPSNNMRVTQFALNGTPEYKIVVSYFGNNPNMIKANIDRWRGQFSVEDSYDKLKLDNKDLTGLKILGTYKLKPRPMAQDFVETPDYGILAAIVPSKEGPYFLKLEAPKEIILQEVVNFEAVLNSYHDF